MKMLAAFALAIVLPGQMLAEDRLQRIEVYPTQVDLVSARSQSQLVVTGHYASGELRDLSGQASFTTTAEGVVEIREGIVRPKKEGKTILTAQVGDQKITVPVTVTGLAKPDPVRFRTEVLAALTKQGCNSGSCHGSPQGKGGFSLSLFGYAAEIDEESLVRGGLNRRLNILAPEDSLMLKKPTMRVAHVGGKKLGKTDLAYAIFRAWIAEGAKTDDGALPRCEKIVVYPGPARVLRFPNVLQQLSVMAHFSDGSRRDITPLATYEVSHKEVLSVDANGKVTGLKRGQGAVSVRYLDQMESIFFTVIEDVPGFVWNSPKENNYVDREVNAKLKQLQVLPADLCDDTTFVRRVHLDLTGLLPSVEQAKSFVADTAGDKRSRKIDQLLESEEFARFWALRTSDLMRVNARTLKEGRADLFGNWVVEAYRTNMPYDEFARKLLTADGETLKNAPANYFLGTTTHEELAETTAQLFMGSRINCAKCHNHPFENWTQNDYYRISAVFARLKKEGMNVKLMSSGEVMHPTSGQVMKAWGSADESGKVEQAPDRRIAFAKWLTQAGNPFFARVEVNRIWAHLLGKGIVHPVDDFRSSNPPSNRELLNALADDFEKHGFDRKRMIRTICNSQTYQRSTATNRFNEEDDDLFSHARIRRLSAEQIQDALGVVAGMIDLPKKDLSLRDRAKYATQRLLPEQSAFLKAFGQPRRESPCACERSEEPTVEQELQLLNGKPVADRMATVQTRYGKLTDDAFTEELYLAAFSRRPTAQEIVKVKTFLSKATDRKEGLADVVWAIVNTREFLFQH